MLVDKEFLTFKCRVGNKYVIYSKNSYCVRICYAELH